MMEEMGGEEDDKVWNFLFPFILSASIARLSEGTAHEMTVIAKVMLKRHPHTFRIANRWL